MSYNSPLDPNSWPPTGYAAQTAGVDVDVGLRQYMLRVYNYTGSASPGSSPMLLLRQAFISRLQGHP